MYTCGICSDFTFDQSIICKRHMTEQHSGFGWRCEECRVLVSRRAAHKKCEGTLKLINRSTMTCTKEEEEQFLQFQRQREDRMITEKVDREGKMALQKDSKKRSHRKEQDQGTKKQRTVLGQLYTEENMVFGNGKAGEKKKEMKKGQEKKRTPEEEKERMEKREEKRKRKEEKEVEKRGKENEREKEKKKEEKEKKKEEKEEKERRKEEKEEEEKRKEEKEKKEKIKENRKELVKKQKEVFSNLLKDMESSSMGSMEEHEAVSLCDPEENVFFDDIVGFTSAVEPISPLPSDPCNTSPDPVMPFVDVPIITIPIDAPIEDSSSWEIPLISTSLCLPLSTQPCETYSPTQEILSPSDLRQAAAIYTPTPVKKLKLEQMSKSQQSRFFINVGGTRFETSVITIQSCPDSLLSEMIKEDSVVKPYLFDGRHTYFLDRDAKHFYLILNYLRNQAKIHSDMLPRDVRSLRELQVECNHYELRHLELAVQKKILDLQQLSLL